MSGLELPGLGPRVALELDPPFHRAPLEHAVIPVCRALGEQMWPLSWLFFGVDEALGLPRSRWEYWTKACVWVQHGDETQGEL